MKNNYIWQPSDFQISEDLAYALRIKKFHTLFKFDYITPKNKIDCLGFLICTFANRFYNMYDKHFFTIDDIVKCSIKYPQVLLYLTYKIISLKEFQNGILSDLSFVEKLDPDWYDKLPTFISNLPLVQEKCKRTHKVYVKNGLDRNGFDKNWENKDGKLIMFFSLKGNFPIKSKDDYLLLYNEYIASHLSLDAFCKEYGITPVDGFNKMLKRISAEEMEKSLEINKLKSENAKTFYQTQKETAKDIVRGKTTLDEFFNNKSYNFDIINIKLYYDCLSFNEQNIFSKLMVDYVYNFSSFVPCTLMKFLTDNIQNPSDIFRFYVKGNLKQPADNEYISKFYKAFKNIKSQEPKYIRKNAYCTIIIGNETFTINDEIIDQALIYAKDNNIYISYKSINLLCSKIAKGEIIYKDKVVTEKSDIIETIIELILDEKTMEDYIATVKKQKIKKR